MIGSIKLSIKVHQGNVSSDFHVYFNGAFKHDQESEDGNKLERELFNEKRLKGMNKACMFNSNKRLIFVLKSNIFIFILPGIKHT